MDFLNLWKDAALILTDSGGLQEETTALGVPCLTLRQNTERPITCDQGTNTLVGTSPERIVSEAVRILPGRGKPGTRPALWDSASAARIVDNLGEMLRILTQSDEGRDESKCTTRRWRPSAGPTRRSMIVITLTLAAMELAIFLAFVVEAVSRVHWNTDGSACLAQVRSYLRLRPAAGGRDER